MRLVHSNHESMQRPLIHSSVQLETRFWTAQLYLLCDTSEDVRERFGRK